MKDKNLIVSILSLIVAILSLSLYIFNQKKAPDLELVALYDSVYQTTGSELRLAFDNKGSGKANRPLLEIGFPCYQPEMKLPEKWRKSEFDGHHPHFLIFEDRDLIINAKDRKFIGTLQLPNKILTIKKEFPLAVFRIESDSTYRIGLIYWDPKEEFFSIRHFITKRRLDLGQFWNALLLGEQTQLTEAKISYYLKRQD